jgi:uncharacterized Zn-binding protein involved in type VI secretion
MPEAVRHGDICSGHECFSPRPNISSSGNVFINGRGAVRVGDAYAEHGCKGKKGHSSVQAAGSGTVFVNGKPLARVGDLVACGSVCATGSGNVFSN